MTYRSSGVRVPFGDLGAYLQQSLRQSTVKSYLYDIKTYQKSNKKTLHKLNI